MPCYDDVARALVKKGKAVVKTRLPFTIKLVFGSSGYRQLIILKQDIGSKVIGTAAVSNGKVLYASEVKTRVNIKSKMQQKKI